MRYFLIGLNTLFGLLGLTLLGIGGYVMVEVKKYAGVTEGSYDGIPIFIICLGLFVFLIAFFGCFGAWKQNSCLTMTYSVVLAILVICQIGAGIAGFVLKDQLFDTLETELSKTMKSWDTTKDSNDKPVPNLEADGWDLLHESFKCCGVNSYQDWTNTTIMGDQSNFSNYISNNGWDPKETEYPTPSSCCGYGHDEGDCGWTYTDPDGTIYEEGCVKKVDNWLEDNISIIAGAAVGIAVVQIVGVLFGCYLIKSENGYSEDFYA